MRFEVIGGLRMSCDDEAIPPGEPQQQKLLALLLASPNQAVSTERLIDEIWRDQPPPSARHLIHVYVARLRDVLDDRDRIAHAGSGYVLRVDQDEVDALEFSTDIEQARDLRLQNPSSAARLLHSATGLWRGHPFGELAHECPMLGSAAQHLEELYLGATEELTAIELELGRHAELIGRLEQLTAEHPYRERFWELRMLALYRCDRQAEALLAYQDLRRALGSDLGIEPGPDAEQLERRILLHDPELQWEPPPPPSNLPTPLSSFVGRRWEVAEVAKLLDTSRLVTLTGTGGIGKTRLAIEVADDIALRFPDGIWWVDLALLRDPELVPAALAETLGVSTQPHTPLVDSIVRALVRRAALILIDNCEHLAAAVAELVGEVLRGTRHARVLATSRSPLHVPGEVRWRVPPLSMPLETTNDPASVQLSDAVRLFVERGAAIDATFRLDARNVDAVVDVCGRLDGLPLAIEMAAGRLGVLSPAQIAEALSDRFALLTRADADSRHETLQAALDWSYDLLDPEDQHLFACFSVFAGSFDLQAAEAVSGRGHFPTVNAIASLVDASMVTTVGTRTETVHYRLLETLREYGLRRLGADVTEQATREAHAEYFLGLAEQARAAIGTADFARWAERLRAEYPDLRQALGWSLAHQPRARTLALALTLFHLWFRKGDGREAGYWGRRMLDGAEGEPAHLRAGAHFVAAFSANILGDPEVAQTNVDAALRLFRESDDRSGLATALFGSCNVALMTGDLERASALAEEALAVSDDIGDGWNRAGSLAILSFVHLVAGSLDEARRCAEQAASLYHELGDVAGQVVMCPLGVILMRQGDLDAAESFAHQSAAVASGTAWEGAALVGIAEVLLARGDVVGAEPMARRGMIRSLDAGVEMWFRRALHSLAQVQARCGAAELAAQLLGASRRNAYGFEVDPAVTELIEERCRADLDEQAFQRAVERGYDMNHEQVLELAQQPGPFDRPPT